MKKFEQRSLKSKEEFAKSLFVVANTIHGAIFVAVLVMPLTLSITAYTTQGKPPVASFSELTDMLDWLQIPFIVFATLSVAAGMFARKRAMDIFDEIASNQV